MFTRIKARQQVNCFLIQETQTHKLFYYKAQEIDQKRPRNSFKSA